MVEILLATYNGERYIHELMDSLLNQTFTAWNLTVGDDCSTDNTVGILKEYLNRYPDKIRIVQNVNRFGSAKDNFFSLINQSTGQYVMLCDQDDIWLSYKIEITLEKMRLVEAEHSRNTPVLVHTDLAVVDEALHQISPSLFQMQKMNASSADLKHLVVQNIVTGCTVMMNRPLVDLVKCRSHENAIMHDWWIALTACSLGEICFIDKPTVMYRQHGTNQVGAKNVRTLSYKINRLADRGEIKGMLNRTYLQAQGFLNVYTNLLDYKQKELLKDYSDIPNYLKLKRLIRICRLGTLKSGTARKLAHFIFV